MQYKQARGRTRRCLVYGALLAVHADDCGDGQQRERKRYVLFDAPDRNIGFMAPSEGPHRFFAAESSRTKIRTIAGESFERDVHQSATDIKLECVRVFEAERNRYGTYTGARCAASARRPRR